MENVKDKPFLGFGPGTYQFQYLKYQSPEEITYLSTKKPFQPGSTTYSWSYLQGLSLKQDFSLLQGGGGSVHSEYFLELTEAGVFSFTVFLSLFFVALKVSLKLFSKTNDKKTKVIVICALLGLSTYFVHSLFNNFLDDCKIAFLFWVSLSVIATIDYSYSQESK